MNLRAIFGVLAVLSLAACGKEEERNPNVVTANNVSTNNGTTTTGSNNTTGGTTGTNNTTGTTGTNNSTGTTGTTGTTNTTNTNNTTNTTGTNNTTQGPGEIGSATVDLMLTIGGREAVMTSCSWDDATALNISSSPDPVNGSIRAVLGCRVPEPLNPTAFLEFRIEFFDIAVGNNAIINLDPLCGMLGCQGNGLLSMAYRDTIGMVTESASSTTADTKAGNFILTAFDPVAGTASGSFDALLDENGVEFRLSGTFSTALADCTGRNNCVGDGM